MLTMKVKIAAATAALLYAGGFAAADSISPDTFEATLDVGESVTITKTVTIDEGVPTTAKVDVFFLFDTTGSMGSLLTSAKDNAAAIVAATSGLGDVHYGVADFKDFPTANWGAASDYPYQLRQAITGDADDIAAAFAALPGPGGGFDIPESNLYALQQAAIQSETGWRDGSQRIVIFFGDAPGHDPLSCAAQGLACTNPAAPLSSLATGQQTYPGPTLTQTIDDLNANGVTVIGVNVTSGPGIDSTGQFSLIANATGGSLFTLGNEADIVAAIQEALEAVFATYSTVSLAAVGNLPGVEVTISSPYVGDFDRTETRTFDFEVTFTGAVAGTHDFVINALVDGGVVATEFDRIIVRGDGVPVPTPAPLPLMLVGLALFGMAGWRRRSAR